MLKEAGFEFEVRTGDYHENYHGHMPAHTVARYIAEQKARAFTDIKNEEILMTADTTVVLHDIILGKPNDRQGAIDMLSSLSGKMHRVITGVCLKNATGIRSFDDTTRVYFRKLRDSEIAYYVDTYKPYDKAGAYGIQEWIGMVGIDRIEGSYFNVMGLPMHVVYRELLSF